MSRNPVGSFVGWARWGIEGWEGVTGQRLCPTGGYRSGAENGQASAGGQTGVERSSDVGDLRSGPGGGK